MTSFSSAARPISFLSAKTLLLGWAMGSVAAATVAAPLPDTPETLRERSKLVRESRDRLWDPASGQLGNLRTVRIVANGCAVRVVSGSENRLIGPREGVRVTEEGRGGVGVPGTPRDVLIAVAQADPLPRGAVCLTLQVATADDFILSGNNTSMLFDQMELPAVRIYLNPSSQLRLWFQDVKVGVLKVSSNASAKVGGTGQVKWLTLNSSDSSTAMFFHEMEARNVGVSATTTNSRFSIRIGSDTKAGYYQPARAGGEIYKLYPIWIDGPLNVLEVPAGRVDVMPLTPAIRSEAQALREEVTGRAGPQTVFPPPDAGAPLAVAPVPITPSQKVADGFARYLPPGVALTSVQMMNAGGALEGTAPDETAVATLVKALGGSPDVTYVQRGYTRPQDGRVAFRVIFNLACAAPGEVSVCLSGSGGAYTEEQIRAELLPLLGPRVMLSQLQLNGREVRLEGDASDADANAALDRIGQQARWIRSSSSGVGKSRFQVLLFMVCAAPPPREGGICRDSLR